jgi:adenosylhomocysteine nucleosidase
MNNGRRRIGVLTPMPSELRPFVRSLSLRQETVGSLPVHTGTHADADVFVATTGMGTATARRVTEQLLDEVGPDHVIVSGIAGGFASVAVGHLLVPEVVVDGDTRVSYTATPLGPQRPAGRLITFGEFLTDEQALRGIEAEGFDAIDMETSAVAAACAARGVPWTAFRSVSDPAIGGPIGADGFALANPDGSIRIGASIRYLVTHPWRIPALARVAQDATRAANAACRAACDAIGAGSPHAG